MARVPYNKQKLSIKKEWDVPHLTKEIWISAYCLDLTTQHGLDTKVQKSFTIVFKLIRLALKCKWIVHKY